MVVLLVPEQPLVLDHWALFLLKEQPVVVAQSGTSAYILANAKAAFSNLTRASSIEFATTALNSTSPAVKMILNEFGRLGVGNATDPQGTLHVNYAGNGSVSQPILNLVHATTTPTLSTRYSNADVTDFGVYNEVTPGLNLAGTAVRWRYRDNGSPSIMTELFNYSGSNLNVNGGFTSTGTGNFAGRIASGSVSATTAGLDITNTTNTDASPGIQLRGTNNILRFGNTVNTAAVFQTVVGGGIAAASSVAWKHVTAANVSTPMMTLEGDGD
ncbi:MAG: hypothetical protein U5M51_02785 [Emticicia sp.]|nr:hypothetical protein [Emticicia sp.]